MTSVYITIDTEYSAGIYSKLGPSCRQENFERSIRCDTPDGAVGIDYQMDVFDRHGLKAVFFVDPMPALVWGVEAISDIVGPIVERGHDVQLHLHSEWLEFAGKNNPLGNRIGKNIKDFSREDQSMLIDYAMTTLMAAGAPRPTAFRAGNYGANDDTLHALREAGIRYDSSHCPGIAESDCAISLTPDDRSPIEHCGIIEIPISSIAAAGGAMRHAQITALSAAEITAAVKFSNQNSGAPFTLVSHSFELLSRDRARTNWIVKRRFEILCANLARLQCISTATYKDQPPALENAPHPLPVLPHSFIRTGWRLGEQALGNALYGAR